VTQVDTNIILFWHSMNKDWMTLVSMTCVTKWKTSISTKDTDNRISDIQIEDIRLNFELEL